MWIAYWLIGSGGELLLLFNTSDNERLWQLILNVQVEACDADLNLFPGGSAVEEFYMSLGCRP